MRIDFSRLNLDQRDALLKHLRAYQKNPSLIAGDDPGRIERISIEIYERGSIDDDMDSHMLGVYIGTTYEGENGDPWFRYLASLGLRQQDLE